jgi:hypothetical protein
MILLGTSLALVFVFLTVSRSHTGGSVLIPAKATPTAPLATEEGYESAVNNIIRTYKMESDAEATYNALILLRVPASDQQVHFDLVVAFGKLMSGKREEGEARLAALHAQNPWLSL